MNTTTRLSTAVVLGLGLMGMSVAADAASARLIASAAQVKSGGTSYSTGKIIHLGTIVVTRADAEGAKAPKAKPSYSTARIGEINVTAADSLEARVAVKAAQRQGSVYLGSISVTAADSTDVHYAVRDARQQPGTLFLGTVNVQAKSRRLPVIGTLVAAVDSTSSRSLLAAVGALVFTRPGG